MRLITLLIVISLSSGLAIADSIVWEFSIIESPNEQFNDFTNSKGFGYQSATDGVAAICNDTEYAPHQIAIRYPNQQIMEVYNCSDWRAGKQDAVQIASNI